jgi:CcmD family protein
MMNKISLMALLMLSTVSGFAQSSALEGTFYQSGKFYVVVFVVAVILLGIFGYLISMDRKIKKLEDRLKD